MKFNKKLLQGTLIKRYKRFFVDIKYKNKTIIAHCPNSGSMSGLLDKGNKVWFSASNNPKRKLKHTLEIIEVKNEKVGINTFLSNQIVFEALSEKKITSLIKFKNIKREVKFSDNTRFDFLLSNDKEKCFLEVKNVTLLREKKIAEFPDAITTRGSKHLKKLSESIKQGYKPFVLFLIQIQDISKFRIAKDIDSEYYKNFIVAKEKGLKFIAYNCKLNSKEIVIKKKLQIIHD